MRAAPLLLVVLASGCGLFQPKNTTAGDPCVDDPTNVILITPTMAKMKPGDRLTFTFEIRSKKGSATAEASIASGNLEPAGSNAVALTAPPVPGSYDLVVSRIGCPMDRNSAAITVEPIASLGKAPGQQPVPSGVAWSPDTTIAVSGRGGVWLFRADGTFIDSEKLPHQGKTTVSFSPDGKYLAVGGDVSERTWVLERENLTPWTKLGVARGSAGHLFSKDGAELYLHEGDALRAFSMATGAMREIGPISQAPSPSSDDAIPRLKHGPLGSVLATVPGELRELSTGRRMAQWPGGAAAISPSGRWVLAGAGPQLPFVPQPLFFNGATTAGGTIFASSLTTDSTLLATGHVGGVNVFRDDGGQLTAVGGATFMNAPGPVLDVAWSPDGSKLAVAGSTRLLILTRQQLGL